MEFLTSVWGPTCDGLDQILKNARLPELEVGERLLFRDMGAYTMAAGSTFNGMPRPDRFYHCSEHVWYVAVLFVMAIVVGEFFSVSVLLQFLHCLEIRVVLSIIVYGNY
jgi:hypothetical protein